MINAKTLASQGTLKQRAHMGPGTLIVNQFRNESKNTQIAFVHAETGSMYPVRMHGGPAGYRARGNVRNASVVNAEVRAGGFVYEVNEAGTFEIGEVLSFSGGADRGGKLQPYSLVATNARSPRRSTILNKYLSRLQQAKVALEAGEEDAVEHFNEQVEFLAEGFPNDFEKVGEGMVEPISDIGRFVESEIATELGLDAEFEIDEELSEEEALIEDAYEIDA